MSAEQRTFLECLSFFSPPQPINTAKQRGGKRRRRRKDTHNHGLKMIKEEFLRYSSLLFIFQTSDFCLHSYGTADSIELL